jgi:hypothetical protein
MYLPSSNGEAPVSEETERPTLHRNGGGILALTNTRLRTLTPIAALAVGLLSTWIALDSAMTAPAPLAVRGKPQPGERHAVVMDGMRFSVTSVRWEGELLEIICCSEFLSVKGGYPGRIKWAFLHPWSAHHVLYWDSRGGKIDHEDRLEYFHDRKFLAEQTQSECHTFTLSVPREARWFAVQYGTCPELMGKVVIPPRPKPSP